MPSASTTEVGRVVQVCAAADSEANSAPITTRIAIMGVLFETYMGPPCDWIPRDRSETEPWLLQGLRDDDACITNNSVLVNRTPLQYRPCVCTTLFVRPHARLFPSSSSMAFHLREFCDARWHLRR